MLQNATGISRILLLMLSAVLVNNFVLSKFLGCCPFLGVSRKVETAFGMGLAVTFVMALASLFTYMVQHFLLIPLKLEYLQTVSFILVIAALVQVVEMFLQKSSPTLYKALGVYLPLITTNCAVLGVAILNINSELNLVDSVLNGTFSAMGFTLAIVLMAGISERLELSDVYTPFKGFAISLVSAGLMSVAFLGFQGLIK